MLKSASEARYRCNLHPHRLAEKQCERCRTGLCGDCTRTYQGQILCEHCATELEQAYLAIPTFRERILDQLITFRNAMIVVGIVAVVAFSAFYFLRPLMNQPITPEEFARFRYAASGGFTTPEGINANSTVLGAKIATATSERSGFEAKHVINEYTGPDYPGWRSSAATFPQDIVVQHEQNTTVAKVILNAQVNEPKETWVKQFEIAISSEGPDRGFVTVGQWEMAQTAGLQRFTFPTTEAKWIRLRILSNYGSSDYTSLNEFDAYNSATNPAAIPTIAGQE